MAPWSRDHKRRALTLACASLALSLAAPVHAGAQSLEYAVKANYLYKFAPFVEWPPGAFASANSPFNVCVFGDAPFGAALDEATQGRRVGDRPVSVHRLTRVSPATNCHVIYVGRSKAARETLRALRGLPVLTVTDSSQGVDGGVVHFVLRRGRVRFAIDTAAARTQGLVVSSKLLGLAVNVRQGGD